MLCKVRAMVRRALVKRLNAPDMPMALERLAVQGFSPELIFDVGANRGDFAQLALALWPSARLACFEPLRHASAQIAQLQRRFPNIDLHQTLVGECEKTSVELHVANASTSLLPDGENQKFPVERFPADYDRRRRPFALRRPRARDAQTRRPGLRIVGAKETRSPCQAFA